MQPASRLDLHLPLLCDTKFASQSDGLEVHVRKVLLTLLVIGVAGVAILAVAGFALARSTIEVPMATRVHHDDFNFFVRSVEFGKQLDGSQDIYVHLTVENDAKVVGYTWMPSTAYLVDAAGRRYYADSPHSSSAKTIPPGQSADVTLVFQTPSAARDLRVAFWDTIMMGDVFDGLRYARLRLRLDS